jgi:hypothetical protein
MKSELSAQKRQDILDKLSQELLRRLSVGTDQFLTPNWEVTKKIQQEEKYIQFNNWCTKNGVVSPSIEYPVAYGKNGELIGLCAKRDIGLCEAYLYVPVNLTINEEQFKRSFIGEIYDAHVQDFED